MRYNYLRRVSRGKRLLSGREGDTRDPASLLLSRVSPEEPIAHIQENNRRALLNTNVAVVPFTVGPRPLYRVQSPI